MPVQTMFDGDISVQTAVPDCGQCMQGPGRLCESKTAVLRYSEYENGVQGMTLIRVMRDDNFLKQMLVLIRRFYSSYVKQRRPPPDNMFFNRNDYQVNFSSFPLF